MAEDIAPEMENNEDRDHQALDTVYNRPISKEMEESYLTYALSVIISRALPDIRDGLKPVHRRILFSMHEQGLRSSAKFSKSARTVGDVIAKYHPHGDAAVYDSMVRMAQDFSMRHPLVRGQGNFGSIDGDSAAAMRYTESKMEKITDEMLQDIDKETIDWQDNYDATKKEPKVLPTKIPQLLLNGTMGIAVGMATNIPPHNLGELIDGTINLIENPELTVEDLCEFIKGPDFPTGGIIYDINAIKHMYIHGRGGVTVRAVTEIEERKGGKYAIVVKEIPYQVNKANLIKKMADLVREKKVTSITDIRDESSRNEIRVVIELKKDSYPKKILNQLFKYTMLQTRFNMNMIALVDRGVQPRLLNLKNSLEYFIEHREEVITRRTEYELKVAKARAHILEGLKIAIDNIDAVIETIRKSETKEIAHEKLMKKFKLSDLQATAILEMRLQTLAGLERKKIEDELKEKIALIAELESILADKKKIYNIMKDELIAIKEKFNEERRTKIVPNAIGEFSHKDTIPDETMIVSLTRANYIKRMTPNHFKAQGRGGKGIKGATTKEEDEIIGIIETTNHKSIKFFTNKGRVYRIPVYEIPQGTRTAKGQAIVNLLQLGKDEVVTAMHADGKREEGEYLFMATKNGTVKKTELKAFENVRKSGLIAINLRDGDSLEWVKITKPGDQVVIITENGQCIRFEESDVRSMGRASTGVRGIKLKGDDLVVKMDIIPGDKETKKKLLVVTENGLGKNTAMKEYRLQNRGGSGIKTANVTKKTGKIMSALVLDKETDADLLIISKKGQTIRLQASAIPQRGRATQGVYVMRLKDSDTVASVSVIMKQVAKEVTQEEAAESKEKAKKEAPAKA